MTELSGVGAFLVVGVERNAAISAMLINRVLTVGFSLVIFLIVAILMRDETKRAWNSRGARGKNKQGQSETHDAVSEPESAPRDDSTQEGANPGKRTLEQPAGQGFTAGTVGPERASTPRDMDSMEIAKDQPLDTASA